MGDLAPAERLQRALEQGALIHPQYKTTFENAFSIAWQKVEHSKGGWAQFTEAQRKDEYLTLHKPDRRLLSGRRLHDQHERLDGRGARVGASDRQIDSRTRHAREHGHAGSRPVMRT